RRNRAIPQAGPEEGRRPCRPAIGLAARHAVQSRISHRRDVQMVYLNRCAQLGAGPVLSSLCRNRTSEADLTTPSEHIDEGLSRRGLVQALAAGAAAATVATPSLADTPAVLAEATSADYLRDPTRWGSAEVAALFPGFKHLDMRTKGAIIRVRHGGSGP